MFDEIEINQISDTKRPDGYTTIFKSSTTLRLNKKIFRIIFRVNNNQSSSWNDKCVEYLSPNGWVMIGTDAHIVQKKNDFSQTHYRIKELEISSHNWTAVCKEYIKNIEIAL